MITVVTFLSNIPGNPLTYVSAGQNMPVRVNVTPSNLNWSYEDHQFVYWCDTQDGTGEVQIYVPSGGPYETLSEDIALYAIWERTTPAVNKVEFDNRTLIDLTGDTVNTSNLMKGVLAHDRSGELIEGTFETYTKSEIDTLLNGKENVGVCIQNGTSEDVVLNGLLALPTSETFLKIKTVETSTRVKTSEASVDGTIAVNAEQGWTPLCVGGFSLSQSWCFMSKCYLDNGSVKYALRYTGTNTSYQNVTVKAYVLCMRTALPIGD